MPFGFRHKVRPCWWPSADPVTQSSQDSLFNSFFSFILTAFSIHFSAYIYINTLLTFNHSYFQSLWCCGSKSPVCRLEIATMVVGVCNWSPVQDSSARPDVAHIPDSNTVHSRAQLWYMLENSPQTPTKTASQTKDWEMCKSNQKEESSDRRSASWQEGSRADGNIQVKTSTQLDVDRHGAISRETEMVGWMSASLWESQSHYWFFFFSPEKEKKVIQWSRGDCIH